jgi:electron transfer flavoprotein beta subunit
MAMKILVAVKRVAEQQANAAVVLEKGQLSVQNAMMTINPFCEIAVEAAIQLMEKTPGTEVIAVSVGPQACQDQLRTALALGTTRAIHVHTDDRLEPLDVAKMLHSIVERENPDLVLVGKQGIGDDHGQTGQMLAALADLPHAGFACEIVAKGDKLQVTREVENGLQEVLLSLPALISTDVRLNEPRYATLPQIMKAKAKPIETVTPQELGVVPRMRQEVLAVVKPERERRITWLESAEELVSLVKRQVAEGQS